MNQGAGSALLIIGNEVLSGRTQDLNVQFLARELGAIGLPLREVRIVPDTPEAIIGAVTDLRAQAECLFTTGGIGPTHDDITAACIAEAFGVRLELNQAALALMPLHDPDDGYNAARRRMATMPEGARLIENTESPAPGFAIGNVFVLAGVPRIMRSMFQHLAPQLPHRPPVISAAVHALPLREGKLMAPLATIAARYPTLDLGSYPFDRNGTYGVTIVAKGTDQPAITAALHAVTEMLKGLGALPVAGEPGPP